MNTPTGKRQLPPVYFLGSLALMAALASRH